ncbi:MAG: response regulator [Patescibacteria group bacterium]
MDKKILFIEDEKSLQEILGQALKQQGFEVKEALNGQDGLDLVAKFDPDLILLDLILPKLNGFEVLEKIKGNEATKNIPVIILTNLENSEDIQRVLELGAFDYLVKSNYSLNEIINKVKGALIK